MQNVAAIVNAMLSVYTDERINTRGEKMVAFRQPTDAPTKLGQILLHTVPPNQYGRKTLLHLAQLIPMTRYGVTKWVNNQRVPPDKVDRLVEIGKMDGKGGVLNKGRVSRADFEPFVYNFPGR